MQIRSQRSELERINSEIEKSYKKNGKRREKDKIMANQVAQGAQARALEEYGVLSLTGS